MVGNGSKTPAFMAAAARYRDCGSRDRAACGRAYRWPNCPQLLAVAQDARHGRRHPGQSAGRPQSVTYRMDIRGIWRGGCVSRLSLGTWRRSGCEIHSGLVDLNVVRFDPVRFRPLLQGARRNRRVDVLRSCARVGVLARGSQLMGECNYPRLDRHGGCRRAVLRTLVDLQRLLHRLQDAFEGRLASARHREWRVPRPEASPTERHRPDQKVGELRRWTRRVEPWQRWAPASATATPTLMAAQATAPSKSRTPLIRCSFDGRSATAPSVADFGLRNDAAVGPNLRCAAPPMIVTTCYTSGQSQRGICH